MEIETKIETNKNDRIGIFRFNKFLFLFCFSVSVYLFTSHILPLLCSLEYFKMKMKKKYSTKNINTLELSQLCRVFRDGRKSRSYNES